MPGYCRGIDLAADVQHCPVLHPDGGILRQPKTEGTPIMPCSCCRNEFVAAEISPVTGRPRGAASIITCSFSDGGGNCKDGRGRRVYWDYHSYIGPSFWLDKFHTKDAVAVNFKVWFHFYRWLARHDKSGETVEHTAKTLLEVFDKCGLL